MDWADSTLAVAQYSKARIGVNLESMETRNVDGLESRLVTKLCIGQLLEAHLLIYRMENPKSRRSDH